MRYILTKGATFQDIKEATGATVIARGRYKGPQETTSDVTDRPLYLHISALRKDDLDKAVDRIKKMMNKPQERSGPPHHHHHGGYTEKIYVEFDKERIPSFNLLGRIIGPKGGHVKNIETKANVKVQIKGRREDDPKATLPNDDDLHIFIIAQNQQSLDYAKSLAQALLSTVKQQYEEFKSKLKNPNQKVGNNSHSHNNNNNMQPPHPHGHPSQPPPPVPTGMPPVSAYSNPYVTAPYPPYPYSAGYPQPPPPSTPYPGTTSGVAQQQQQYTQGYMYPQQMYTHQQQQAYYQMYYQQYAQPPPVVQQQQQPQQVYGSVGEEEDKGQRQTMKRQIDVEVRKETEEKSERSTEEGEVNANVAGQSTQDNSNVQQRPFWAVPEESDKVLESPQKKQKIEKESEEAVLAEIGVKINQ